MPDSYSRFANAFNPGSGLDNADNNIASVRALPGKINLKTVKEVCWSAAKESAA